VDVRAGKDGCALGLRWVGDSDLTGDVSGVLHLTSLLLPRLL
jgi:hypothetical protein